MEISNEQWRPIPGYEGYYEASDLGRIRSVDRMIPAAPSPYLLRGRVLRPHRLKGGRLKVALSMHNRRRMVDVSRLVGETWLGIPPEGHCIAHISTDRSDNTLGNLKIALTREVVSNSGKRGRGRLHSKCRRGHALAGDNIRYNKNGSRQCRKCNVEYNRTWREHHPKAQTA
jgi:hypothetical protein